MNYLSLLDEDEIRYICSEIPVRDAAVYFKRNPKEFAKLRPGFRTTIEAIAKLDIGALLFNHRNKNFISLFIETYITEKLDNIQQNIEQCINNGDSKEMAFIRTLPYCFFSGNIEIYFKLVNEEYSEEFISLLQAAIKIINESKEHMELQQEEIRFKEVIIKKLNAKLEQSINSLEKANRKITRKENELEALRLKNKEVEKLIFDAQKMKTELEQLRQETERQKKTIDELKAELLETKKLRMQIKEQKGSDIEKQGSVKNFV